MLFDFQLQKIDDVTQSVLLGLTMDYNVYIIRGLLENESTECISIVRLESWIETYQYTDVVQLLQYLMVFCFSWNSCSAAWAWAKLELYLYYRNMLIKIVFSVIP